MDRRDETAAFAPLAATLLVFITVAVSAVAYVTIQRFDGSDAEAPQPGLITDNSAEGYIITMVGGDPVPVGDAVLVVSVDGQEDQRIPLGDVADFGDTWTAGEGICLIGPGCFSEAGAEVEVRLMVGKTLVFQKLGPTAFPPLTPVAASDADEADHEDEKEHKDHDSGHEEITICHQVGKKSQTMVIDESAWKGHEKHGDSLGACE